MSNSRGSALGSLACVAVCGLGVWASYAVGAALGMTGLVAVMAGGGIIAAGIFGLGLVCVAAIALIQGCRSCCTNLRNNDRAAAVQHEAHDARVLTGTNTTNIARGLNVNIEPAETLKDTPIAPISYPPEYQSPPASLPANSDIAYYEPPCRYGTS